MKEIVATAVRMEYDKNNNEVYIVFRIIDEKFKQKVRDSWEDEIELKLINNVDLIEEDNADIRT